MTLIAQELPDGGTVAITHDHMMYSLAARKNRGERAVFSNTFAPHVRRGSVNLIGLVIGGAPPLFGIDNEDPWWGYADRDIHKIFGGNLLRVYRQVVR